MNTSEKIQALVNQSDGPFEIGATQFLFFNFTRSSEGWISVTDDDDSWFVLYTSDKHTHWPYGKNGPALGVDFNKATGEMQGSNGLTGAWQSAITMWPVKDHQQAEEIFARMKSFVDSAYQFNIKG